MKVAIRTLKGYGGASVQAFASGDASHYNAASMIIGQRESNCKRRQKLLTSEEFDLQTFRINLSFLLQKGIADAKSKGSPTLFCGCGRCEGPLPVMFSVERFEKPGLREPLYDTKGAAKAGRLEVVHPSCNGGTNINSIPVKRPQPVGFLTQTVGTSVTLVLERLEVVARARAEEEKGLKGDRYTAKGRTARNEEIVVELEGHVQDGTLRKHIRGQIETILEVLYPEWEDNSRYYPCPHCENKGLSWEEEALDFGSPSVRLDRALHFSNNPRQASPDHMDPSLIDYQKGNVEFVHMMCQKIEHNNPVSEEPLTIELAQQCVEYIDSMLKGTYHANSSKPSPK